MLTPERLDGGRKQGLGAEGAGGCCLICSLPLRAHVELGEGVQREHADSGVQITLAAAQWLPLPTSCLARTASTWETNRLEF